MTELQQRTSWYSSATNQGQIRSGGPWNPEQLLSMHQWLSQALGHLKWNCWRNRWKSGVAEWLARTEPVTQLSVSSQSLVTNCHQHSPNWINPLILLVDNINVSLIKLHAPASFRSLFCPHFCPGFVAAHSRAEEPRSWRTGELMPDMCTYMCGHM